MTPEVLLGARLVLHIATALTLMSYYRPDARFRGKPSVLAGMLVCSSGAMAVQILTQWQELIAAKPQPQLVIFVFSVFMPIIWARGDMAKLYDALVRIRPHHFWPWH